jgi:hypothetical protein
MNSLNPILCLLFLLCSTTKIIAQSSVNRNRVMEYLQDQQYDEAIAYLKPAVNTADARQRALLAYVHQLRGIASIQARYRQPGYGLLPVPSAFETVSIGRIYDAHLRNGAMATRYYKRYIRLYKGKTPEEKEIYRYLKTRIGE